MTQQTSEISYPSYTNTLFLLEQQIHPKPLSFLPQNFSTNQSINAHFDKIPPLINQLILIFDQITRFHALAAFDQKKRSCRRRLSDHNARRRKPQPDSFSFSSSRLSSPFYDERRQISFMWNKAPFQILRQTQQASWADESDFKISNSKEFQMKPCNPNPNLLNPFRAEGFKGSPPIQVLNQGPEARAPDNNLRRALSLLSSSSQSSPLQNSKNTPASPAWRDPASSLLHFNSSSTPSPPVQAATLAASNSSYWFDEDQAASFSVQNGSNGGVHFQEFRVLKPAAVQYETAAFFDSSQIR